MSFGKMFDGYCVVHAEHCTSDRRVWFEQELNRIGVNNYTIVAAPKIDDHDPRLIPFKRKNRTKMRISLYEAVMQCIEIAKSKKWRNVVIMGR